MRDGKPVPGLFIVGTDTDVGKTYVAARIAAALVRAGKRVGVYKPAASGCRPVGDDLVSDDAVVLWEAAGRPETFDAVCPQRFATPLAPHLAAREEKKSWIPNYFAAASTFGVELANLSSSRGAGGLMSPLGDREYVADLAAEFGFPIVLVVPNRIGAINAALTTLIAGATRPKPLPVAGIVLNDILPPKAHDPSTRSNRHELELHCDALVLAQLSHRAKDFDAAVDWLALASGSAMGRQRQRKVR